MNKDKVIKYCINDLKVNEKEAERLFGVVSKFEDIYAEFLNWLETHEFSDEFKVSNYSPLDIHKLAPRFNGIGVYNFLVTIREEPELAEEIIRTGFIVK